MSALPPPVKQNKAVRAYSHSLSLSATAEAVRKGQGQLSISPCPDRNTFTMDMDNFFQFLSGPPRAPENAPPKPRLARRGQQESMLMVAGQQPTALAQQSRAAGRFSRALSVLQSSCHGEHTTRQTQGCPQQLLLCHGKGRRPQVPARMTVVPLLFCSPAFVGPPSAQGGD